MSAVAVKDSSTGKELAAEPVKILLVDDQPDNLLSAEAVLEILGEEIVKAESGREALRQLLEHDFAVIVLDVMMPDMDGFETAALIRERERSRHTPIIFLTALGRGEEHIRRGYTLGAVDYLTKPFVPEILRTKVSVFVELHRKTALLRVAIAAARAPERGTAASHSAKLARRRGDQGAEPASGAPHRRVERTQSRAGNLQLHRLARLARPAQPHLGIQPGAARIPSRQLDDQGRLYLNRIEHSARRMNDLVEDLLSLSRVTRVEMTGRWWT